MSEIFTSLLEISNDSAQADETEKHIQIARAELEGTLIRIEKSQFNPPIPNYDFFGDQKNEIRETCEFLFHWLNLDYLYDKFGNDNKARQEWREDFCQKHVPNGNKVFSAYFNKNKFFDGMIFSAGVRLQALLGWIKRSHPELEQNMRIAIYANAVPECPKDDIVARRMAIGKLEERILLAFQMIADASSK